MAMRFEHEFSVPVPVEQAWAVLLDVEKVAPCLPGASLDSVEGDDVAGRMRVKVGPITVTYKGTVTFENVDKDAHTLTIRAAGKELRGAGTASATVDASLRPEGDQTKVRVETSFNVTGRPAQFGRGVMAEVGGRMIEKFAGNLATLLQDKPEAPRESGEASAEGEDPGEDEFFDSAEPQRHLSAVPSESRDPSPAGTLRTSRTPEEEALDLLEVAGVPVLKRLAPLVGGLVLLGVLIWVIRRLTR
ncbi:SRPBCC family protein [Streptosporangiaceae bacterium NEAU-GS5]|nr:SRPBCC family protein [Streptosporangiaceae bacterium NEAU-GS5]